MNYRLASVQVFAVAADTLQVRPPCARDGDALLECDAVRNAGAADRVPESHA